MERIGGMYYMFTAINGVFRLSKEGGFAKEVLENIGDDVKKIVVYTYGGKEYYLNCDDFLLTLVKEVSYDTCEEKVYKDGITVYCELDEDRDLEKCHMVKLKGVHFKVIRYDGLILLNNEITNKVEHTCQINSFKGLLESLDEGYEVYRKEYIDL